MKITGLMALLLILVSCSSTEKNTNSNTALVITDFEEFGEECFIRLKKDDNSILELLVSLDDLNETIENTSLDKTQKESLLEMNQEKYNYSELKENALSAKSYLKNLDNSTNSPYSLIGITDETKTEASLPFQFGNIVVQCTNQKDTISIIIESIKTFNGWKIMDDVFIVSE